MLPTTVIVVVVVVVVNSNNSFKPSRSCCFICSPHPLPDDSVRVLSRSDPEDAECY